MGATSSATCTPAPAGTYVPAPGATEPTPCPVDQYQLLTGQTSCLPDANLVLATRPGITVLSTSPAGAVVTYTLPVATDLDGTPVVSCLPASGSTFPIGSTTVTCTATETGDANSPATSIFVVTVLPATELTALSTQIASMDLAKAPKGLANALQSKVQSAMSHSVPSTACGDLTALINQANAQSGKGLTTQQALDLIAAATAIRTLLGCP